MATVWKGTISFGLVTIPVELHPAVRHQQLSFRMLHAEDLEPVKYERVCSADGETVPWSEVVKGYEYAKGKYIVLTEEDFEAAALEQSRSFDIVDFVKSDEIDPRFFETPYYLLPGKGGEKGYALLRDAMRKSDAVGIGKIIIRQSQHLAAVKVVENALVLETMRFANELVDADALSFPDSSVVRPQELAMAEQLVANLADKFDPEKYTDDYRANLMRVIKAKLKGEKIDVDAPETTPAETQVVDLMARLKASLEQSESGRRAAAKKSGTAAARSARKKRRSA